MDTPNISDSKIAAFFDASVVTKAAPFEANFPAFYGIWTKAYSKGIPISWGTRFGRLMRYSPRFTSVVVHPTPAGPFL